MSFDEIFDLTAGVYFFFRTSRCSYKICPITYSFVTKEPVVLVLLSWRRREQGEGLVCFKISLGLYRYLLAGVSTKQVSLAGVTQLCTLREPLRIIFPDILPPMNQNEILLKPA